MVLSKIRSILREYFGGIHVDVRTAFPGVRREAGLLNTAVLEKLRTCPSHFLRHFRQIGSAVHALANPDTVLADLDFVHRFNLAQGGQDGNLDADVLHLGFSDRIVEEPVILRGRRHSHLGNNLMQRDVLPEMPDTAAQAAPVGERDEYSPFQDQVLLGYVVGFGKSSRQRGKNAFAGDTEQFSLLFGSESDGFHVAPSVLGDGLRNAAAP